MLTLGIPKEIKPFENRVGLTPSCARVLSEKGVRVFVETRAGEKSGFKDSDYQKAGAEVLGSADQVYARAEMIQKVKEPQEAEFHRLGREQVLFCYLHLASPENCKLVKTLVEKGITAVGFETLETGGALPLLAPMSEIAGSLSAAYASFFKNNPEAQWNLSSLERVAAQFPDLYQTGSPGRAVIWGGGTAGQAALRTVLRLGGKPAVIEKNPERREILKTWTPDVFDPAEVPEDKLREADVFIGSVHVRGARAFQVLTPEKLADYSREVKKILMDISIDQGGNFPDSRPTTYERPVYRDTAGNLRFCVPNIPSLGGQAASEMLSRAALPYTLEFLQGIKAAFKNPDLKRAVNVRGGEILIPEVARAHDEKTAEA